MGEARNHDIGKLRHRVFRAGPLSHEVTNTGFALWSGHATVRKIWDFFETLDSGSGLEGWHLDESGSSTTALSLDADGMNGVALIAPGSSATNNTHYQWATNATVLEPVTMAVGKRTLVRARFKIEDADQNLILIGLHEAADDPWGTYPNDSFLIRTISSDADGLVGSISTSNSAIQNTSSYTISDDTFYTAEIYYNGEGKVEFRVYSDAGAILHDVKLDAPSTVVPTSPMTVAFGVEAVDTGADDFHIDFIEVIQDRYTGAL